MLEINVDQLEGDSSYDLNINKFYINTKLLRLLTPSREQKAMINGTCRRNGNNQKVIFSILFLFRA